jgi:serine/threonine protein phosphatase PrpC
MTQLDDFRLRSGAHHAAPPAARAAWASHPGHRRPVNEDRAAVGDGWAVVADGVGSVPGSDAAAGVAVAEFGARAAGIRSAPDAVDAVRAVNARVLELVGAGDLAPGVATTLVGAVVVPGGVVVVGVGDSPAWALDGAGARLVCRPRRRWDPLLQSFTLLAAIGGERPPDPELAVLPSGDGLRVVLASDGVLETEPDSLVPATVRAATGPDVVTAALRVVARTLAGPARDNVTVAVLDVGAPQSRRAG